MILHMSPTIFREGSFRFFFFSREEPRMHVHVSHTDGECKFWMQPKIEMAMNQGLSSRQLSNVEALVIQHQKEIVHAWHTHFGN
jgi:hypothetical protein